MPQQPTLTDEPLPVPDCSLSRRRAGSLWHSGANPIKKGQTGMRLIGTIYRDIDNNSIDKFNRVYGPIASAHPYCPETVRLITSQRPNRLFKYIAENTPNSDARGSLNNTSEPNQLAHKPKQCSMKFQMISALII